MDYQQLWVLKMKRLTDFEDLFWLDNSFKTSAKPCVGLAKVLKLLSKTVESEFQYHSQSVEVANTLRIWQL